MSGKCQCYGNLHLQELALPTPPGLLYHGYRTLATNLSGQKTGTIKDIKYGVTVPVTRGEGSEMEQKESQSQPDLTSQLGVEGKTSKKD